MRAAVMGLGSWGTAFGLVLADAGHSVALWGRNLTTVAEVNSSRRNAQFHPDLELPASVTAHADTRATLAGADLVVLAVPAQSLRANLSEWADQIPRGAVVLSLLKGLEQGSHARMSEVVASEANCPAERIAVLSGPNLAREVVRRQPTASVIACADGSVATQVQEWTRTPYFRPYTNADVVGVELGGVVKNVIALATGMAEGMGFGDNSKAAIMTRGLAEMTRLGVAMAADPLTFMGLAGVGDLIATCSSPLSRNRTFGENLGRGMTMDEVAAITAQTAEGVTSCAAVLELAQEHHVDMPITEHVSGVIEQGWSPRDMVVSLMSRVAKPEWHRAVAPDPVAPDIG
ncbi:MAG: NAD(P)-dependent glycerol-3-phosphate dehydrogenase [Actinomycetia bacterium]|nr:NAD(P)-dependent glycerol-3-phosphate dehydrogenase [Actinomycetes bacterium]